MGFRLFVATNFVKTKVKIDKTMIEMLTIYKNFAKFTKKQGDS